MKTLAKILLAVIIAFFCVGAYKNLFVQANVQTELRYFHEVVRPNDTFNGVIEHYYNYDNEKESWDEWQTKVKAHNKTLFFYEDGRPRMLQIGDVICIPVNVKTIK